MKASWHPCSFRVTRHIFDRVPQNKLGWYLNQDTDIFFKENAFENCVYKMLVILFRPQCFRHLCINLYCLIKHGVSKVDQWWNEILSRVYTIRDATWRDATRLGRMIGFQWNQQDRSHYARRDVTRRDGTRLRRPNWLLYPNNRAESRSKRDSLGFCHQRNPFPRIVTRLTRLV